MALIGALIIFLFFSKRKETHKNTIKLGMKKNCIPIYMNK